MSEPEWLTVNARVAVISERDYKSIVMCSVERIGKRDVVLSNGDRFAKTRLIKYSGGTWSTGSTELVAADDPRVKRLRTQIEQSNAKSSAIGIYEGWRRGEQSASDVAVAFTALSDGEA